MNHVLRSSIAYTEGEKEVKRMTRARNSAKILCMNPNLRILLINFSHIFPVKTQKSLDKPSSLVYNNRRDILSAERGVWNEN